MLLSRLSLVFAVAVVLCTVASTPLAISGGEEMVVIFDIDASAGEGERHADAG